MNPESNPSTAILLGELQASIESFRLGMNAQANSSFVRFIDALSAWFDERGEDEEIAGLLPAILACQERGDVLAVADLLEHGVGGRILRVLRAEAEDSPELDPRPQRPKDTGAARVASGTQGAASHPVQDPTSAKSAAAPAE